MLLPCVSFVAESGINHRVKLRRYVEMREGSRQNSAIVREQFGLTNITWRCARTRKHL